MLDALRFVKGAVARKDFMPVLTHFRIEGGRIIGSDGNLALSSPVDIAIEASPKAGVFATAIANCDGPVAMVQLPNGSLAIRSGAFKAVVDCSTDVYPTVPVGGRRFDIPFKLIPVLKTLERFISEDASRPWSQGILLRGKSAFATNNVIVVEQWIGVTTPVEINIPTKAVAEMIRIDEEPEYIEIAQDEDGNATSLTVRYSDDRWLYHPAVGGEWPDTGRYLNKSYAYKPFPLELFPALRKLKPLAAKDQAVYMAKGNVRTNLDPELGSSMDVADLEAEGKYSLPQLNLLEGIANAIDFSDRLAGFKGTNLRGVIYGMRL